MREMDERHEGSVRSRLARLGKNAGTGNGDGRCPACPDVIHLFRGDGEPDPPAPCCGRCGRPVDCVVIHEVIVETREEAEEAMRRMREALPPV